ncbi:MAG: peptidase M50 [Paracoccaceae bacterium]|nr:peptidase M50 [Paracoccaceae bacterium]
MAVELVSALRHPDWHLLSDQKFRRRAAIGTSHQMFRGEAFVVLCDRVTGHNLRLTERAQELWQLFDGRRTLNDIWEHLMRRPAIAPSQGELVEWVMQLVGTGLILSDHELDPIYLSDRTNKRRSSTMEQRFASPLAIKIKLFDPSWLVRKTYPLVGMMFTPFGGLVVAAVLLSALVLAVMNWEALFQSADQTILSQSGLLGLALAYPIMKGLHELSHCYALYRFGGQVREFGIMLLLFFPVPYVEASEATALPDKRARMLVGAAGILSELFIASIALMLWLQIEPGVERALLFNFVLIGSISTILFNGNPLLKFDAYFVLADYLEMPNLAQRSGEYLQDRFLSRILGLRSDVAPRQGEARILGTYGTLALSYRMLLTLTIALLVSTWFFVFGVLLAAWVVIIGAIWPLVKVFKKGFRMTKSQNRARRVLVRLTVFLALLVGLTTLVPLPFSAQGEGRIVPLASAEVSVETSGLIAATNIVDGMEITAGMQIMRLDNASQTARRLAMDMNVTFLQEALSRSGLTVPERQRVERELEVARTALANAEDLEQALDVRAPISGRISWQGGRPPPPGAFAYRGDRLGHIINPDALQVVTAFPAAYSGRIDEDPTLLMLLPNGDEFARPVARSRVVDVGQQVPPELLVSAGGPVPEQPDRPGMALDTSYIVWAAPQGDLSAWAGARVVARIDLGSATALEQMVFHVQRLFLRVTRL